ncbi:MAG: hypothetical protein Phyf2KO_18450 [Phycisphaerales bacterium]
MLNRPRTTLIALVGSAAGIVATGAPLASAQPITEDLKVTPADGAANDEFGHSIAVEGGVIAVGAWVHDGIDQNTGSAYLYDGASGNLLHKLTPSDGTTGDQFGASVAIDNENDVVAVGAIRGMGIGDNTGSAYLYDVATGNELRKLFAPSGADGDRFGQCIAIAEGIVAVGAPGDDAHGSNSGAVYIFDASTGVLLHTLRASDANQADQFGSSIAIQDGIVAVGATYDDDNGIDAGSVYIFDAVSGQELREIYAIDGAASDRFGDVIDIDSGVLAVGVPSHEHGGLRSGAGYLIDLATGAHLDKLLPAGRAFGEAIGGSISIDNGIVCLGAWSNNDNGNDSGTAYLFDVSTGAEIVQLLPSDPADQDRFGISAAMGGGVVAVGAINNTVGTLDSGSVYVFAVPQSDCLADVNNDGMLTPADFTAWINAYNSQLPECDQNGDGSCTPTDFTAWIANYSTGC